MNEPRKAYALITSGHSLLVFKHRDLQGLDIQLPGGTVEPHESPQEAVMREAEEETGLSALQLVGFLGEQRIEYVKDGVPHSLRHYYYHLTCDAPTPPRWQHAERYASGEPEGTEIWFELFWVPLESEVQIFALQQHGIDLLLKSLSRKET